MNSKPIADLTCRVCLNIEELMVNIYEEVEDFQSNLVELLEACGGLTVDRLDNLPKYLCKVCAGELLVAAKFREKCAKSNELLCQLSPKLEQEGAHLVYVSHANALEANSIDTMSEEILNEIIIEEVEEKIQVKIEWNEDPPIKNERQSPLIEIQDPPFENSVFLIEDESQEPNIILQDAAFICENQVQTTSAQSEDDFILSDHEDAGYIVETITNMKQNVGTKKKLQEAAPLKFDCDECGAAFSNHVNLKRHLRLHQEFAEKLHTCPRCFHAYTKAESLQIHYKTIHPGEITQNEICPKKTKTRNEVCDTCGKICNTKANLKVHIRTHTGDRPYPCTECSKAFKTQAALSLHLKRHAGQFDWECEVCGKAFIESSNLRVHMRTHTGEKPHLCKVCGKKFSRVFLLQLHLRTHTGEKPYKCDTCEKAYCQKCDLDIHVRSHTGVRPYVCPVCFRGFVKSYALQKHVRQHPKELVLRAE